MTASDPLGIVDQFLQANIALVVIGGHAVNVHGYARATEDVDILFQRTPESEQALFDVLTRVNAFYVGDVIDPETGLERTHPITQPFIQSNHLMMLGSDLGYIDLFDFVPGLPEAQVEDVIASGIRVAGRPFADLRWLRKLKQASNRPQDRIDLENLPADR